MPIPIVPMLGAAFVLSDKVLNDPAHAMHKAYLSGCPSTDLVTWLSPEVV